MLLRLSYAELLRLVFRDPDKFHRISLKPRNWIGQSPVVMSS